MVNVAQLLMQHIYSYANTYKDAGIDVTVSLQSKGKKEGSTDTALPECMHQIFSLYIGVTWKNIAQHW